MTERSLDLDCWLQLTTLSPVTTNPRFVNFIRIILNAARGWAKDAQMPSANPDPASRACTAFVGSRLLLAGALADVALAVNAATPAATDPILVFDDATGRVIDLDLRGSKAEIVARLAKDRAPRRAAAESLQAAEKRGRGRPKLGVVPREVTLLPRHWDWLAAQ